MSTDQLDEVSDPETDTVMCFTLTSLGETCMSPPWTIFTPSLQTDTQTRPDQPYQHPQLWFTSINKRSVPNITKYFQDFMKANNKFKFIAASILEDSTPGASIHLYQGGRSVDSDYEPVSKPDPVQVTDTQHCCDLPS